MYSSGARYVSFHTACIAVNKWSIAPVSICANLVYRVLPLLATSGYSKAVYSSVLIPPGQGQYSTCLQHRSPAHRAHAEWSPSRLIAWAEKTGPTARLVTEILHRRRHPEQGYRACLGLIGLGRHHGEERLEAACARAERFLAYSYRAVKNILTAGLDRLPLDELDTQTAPRGNLLHLRGATPM